MRRWAFLAVFAVAAAGAAIGVALLSGTSEASTLPGVVAQVQREFGDHKIVGAKIEGSTLRVLLSPTAAKRGGGFDAAVLSAAVADWMQAHGTKPITQVLWFSGSFKSAILHDAGSAPVPTPSVGYSVSRDACESAKADAPRGTGSVFAGVSVTWLPYLNGTCVVRMRTTPRATVTVVHPGWTAVTNRVTLSNASAKVSSNFQSTIGTRPSAYFLEMDDAHGRPLLWSYGVAGMTGDAGGALGIWQRQANMLAHGG
jgi:hypothetical protein